MAGSEIEDFAAPAVKAAAAAKDLAAGKPADQDDGIWRRDVKMFAVHFVLRDLKIGGQSIGDGVARVHNPEPFVQAVFTPTQAAGGPHQPTEDFGMVARMEHDQPHPFEHPALYPVDELVAHLVVGDMAPPDQHIGLGQGRLAQPLLRVVEGDHLGVDIALRPQALDERRTDSVRVDLLNGLVAFFVLAFVPDQHLKRVLHGSPS